VERPLIGFVYADIAAHNPSVPSINQALLETPGVRVQGLEVSKASSVTARQLVDDSDVIVVESSCLLGRVEATGEPKYRRFENNVDPKVVSGFFDMIWESNSTIVLLEGNYDLHAPLGFGLSAREMERIDYLIWPYTAEPVSYNSSARPARYFEPWTTAKLDPLDNWRRITRLIPKQIEYHHALGAADFGTPGPAQLWDAIVPGARYITREIASTSVRQEGLSLAPYHGLDKTLRIGTSAVGSLWGRAGDVVRFNLRRANMRQLMRYSGSAYVCGGGYEYFVRKFLEVPALGLPMFGYPVEPLSRLGFQADEHYVPTLPENFGQHLLKARRDPARPLSAMAQRSQLLVHRFHTARTRAQNLLDLVSGTRDKAFHKAVFVNGSIVPVK